MYFNQGGNSLGSFVRRVLASLLLIAATQVCLGCHGRSAVARRANNQGGKKMDFPSFEPVSESPEIAELGVVVELGATEFKVGDPVTLYGSYLVDGEFTQRCHDEPHTWIVLIVIRRDQPGVWSKPVREKPNLAPVPLQQEELPGPTFRRGGYFNLDLREHLGIPDEPGSYWLIVSMGNYITDPIPFNIRF